MAADVCTCFWCQRKPAAAPALGLPICDDCKEQFTAEARTAKRPAWLAAEQWADLQEIAKLVGMVGTESQRHFLEEEAVMPLAVRMRVMPDGSIGLEHWVPRIPALLARIREVQSRHPEQFQERRNG